MGIRRHVNATRSTLQGKSHLLREKDMHWQNGPTKDQDEMRPNMMQSIRYAERSRKISQPIGREAVFPSRRKEIKSSTCRSACFIARRFITHHPSVRPLLTIAWLLARGTMGEGVEKALS